MKVNTQRKYTIESEVGATERAIGLHSPPRSVAAIAGSEPPAGVHPTLGGNSSASRKRRRRRRKKSHSGSKISSNQPGSTPRIDPSLANYEGEILVLFETPSGFAIFSLKKCCLNKSNAMENIWAMFGEEYRAREILGLKEFKLFKDKFSAINHCTGVSTELTEMISRYHHPYQILAVGKPEYKRIIETNFCSPGVHCLFDETVMEVMWGLKNLMPNFVPEEKLKLTKEDRLPMSQGLKKFLDGYGFDVKPEMVKEDIVVTACLLRDAELIEKRHSKQLLWAADKLKDVSGINSQGWSMMKIATALKIIFDPVETTDDDMEMFTPEEVTTLESDALKYEYIIHEDSSLKIYSDLVEMREVKKDALEILGFWFS